MTKRIFTLFMFLLPLVCFAKNNRSVDNDIEWADNYVDINPDSALIAVRIVEERYRRRLTASDHARLAIIRGNAWFSNGEISKGLADIRQAVALSREARDTSLLINSLSDLGVMSRVAQKPDSALICYNEALKLMHLHGASAEDEAHLLTSIAILYTNTQRLTDAVPFVRQAVAKAEKSGSMETMMYAGSQGGIILFLAGYKDEGLSIERRIVSMAERNGAPRYVLKTYASIIDMHYKCGNRDSVMFYIDRGNEIMDKVPEGSVESLGFLEESYVVLAAMGRYRESLAVQHRILAMKDAGTYMPMDKLWLRMARNYDALGQDKQAADAYERSICISDSLRNTEIDKQLSEFQVKYDTMQKELDISRLSAEKANSVTLMVVAGAVFILVLAGLVAYIFLRRRHEAYARVCEHLKGVEEERGRLARDLHDGICNDLYGLSLLMQSSSAGKKEVAEGIRQIAGEVRSISHELMPPRFKSGSLDDLLAVYALQSNGFVDYVSTSSEQSAIAPEVAYQVYRIVQELVQNIRKHTTAGDVRLTADYGRGIKLTLTYSGEPHNVSRSRSDGIGTITTQRRAELIGANIQHEQDGNVNTVIIERNDKQ